MTDAFSKMFDEQAAGAAADPKLAARDAADTAARLLGAGIVADAQYMWRNDPVTIFDVRDGVAHVHCSAPGMLGFYYVALAELRRVG